MALRESEIQEARNSEAPSEKAPESSAVLKKMWEAGLPVRKARFQGEVNNGIEEPQWEFNLGSAKPNRRVDMRLVPQGLLCFHEKVYFLVPLPHIKQLYFK